MTKHVKAFIPYEPWQIAELESWFIEKLLEGKHVAALKNNWAYFEVGEPTSMLYRIEFIRDNVLMTEQLDLYAEAGWNYIAGNKSFHLFASPKEGNPQEIYTDPSVQAETLSFFQPKLKRELKLSIVVFAIVFAVIAGSIFVPQKPVFVLVNWNALMVVYLSNLIVFGQLLGNTAIRYSKFKRTYHQLEQGIPIDRNGNGKNINIERSVVFGLYASLCIVLIALCYFTIMKPNQSIYVYGETQTNFISLEEIQLIDEPFTRAGANHYETMWSPFTKSHHRLVETIEFTNQMDELTQSERTYRLEQEKVSFRTGLLKDRYVRDLLKEKKFNRYTDGQLLERRQFDALYLEAGAEKEIIAFKNNDVFYFSYEGGLSTTQFIDAISNLYAN